MFSTSTIAKCLHHPDSDCNGRFSADEVDQVVDRSIIESGRSAEVTPGQQERTRTAGRAFWDAVVAFADLDADGSIALDEYVEAFRTRVENDPAGFAAVTGPALTAFGDLMDVDDDGTVSFREFVALHRAYGIGDEATRVSFDRLDTDGDGTLSLEELAVAAQQCSQGTDVEAPGNDFWGPIDWGPIDWRTNA